MRVSDSSWSDPNNDGPGGDADGPDDAGSQAGTDAGTDEPGHGFEPLADGQSSLGPRSSALPNVPDITPVTGTPMPGPADVAPEGTAVMPVVPVAPPPRPAPGPTAMAPIVTGSVGSSPPGAPSDPRYVVAQRVPWYRTPDGRARAGIGLGLATLLIVGGIIWFATRSSDDGNLVATDDTTTTSLGQFGTNIDGSTTTLAAPIPVEPTTTSLVETTIEPTITAAPTTTTTTEPPATSTTTTSTSATSTTTSTTTTSTSTTSTTTTSTTTTLPSLPEVVVPNSTSTIGEIIQASPGLSELDSIMSSVGFYAELNAITDPYTLFAPSNAAIEMVQETLPADPEAVRQILRRHVTVDGRFGSRELFGRTELTMLDGSIIVVDAGAETVGGAVIVVADKGGADTNQIVHVVSSLVGG